MLKLIACVLMLIDHCGYFLYDFLPPDVYVAFRSLGRLAFPLFAYSIALGFRRTRGPFRYLFRMSLAALVTEGVLRAASSRTGYPFPPNVMITFAAAILFLIGYELAVRSRRDMIATLRIARSAAGPCASGLDFPVRIALGGTGLPPSVGLPLGVLAAAAAVAATLLIQPDYGIYGLMHVVIFHLTAARIPVEEPDPACRSALRHRTYAGILALNLAWLATRILLENASVPWSMLQLLSVFAVPLLLTRMPDPKPGLAAKYGFYMFYPLHIVLLMVIGRAL